MMARIFLFQTILFFEASVAYAEQLPPPIEINPSYQECLEMAERALEVEALGVDIAAETLGQEGVATPVELPAGGGMILPGLEGNKDFEKALKEKGVMIITDPDHPSEAPRVELQGIRPPSEEAEEALPLPEEGLYQQKRHVCRIKFGIHF